jgi:uncharacterized protein YjlB
MTLEDVKAAVERTTGWRRPSAEQLAKLLQSRRIAAFRFRDDGFIPNNSWFPVVVYRSAVKPSRSLDSAAVWEALFLNPTAGAIPGATGYTISPLPLANSRSAGSAIVRLGGNKGRIVKLKAGGAVVIPAGTGHQCLSASETFVAVGTYPPKGTYDASGPTVDEHDRNVKEMRKLGRPRKDPIFGSHGPSPKAWKAKRKA